MYLYINDILQWIKLYRQKVFCYLYYIKYVCMKYGDSTSDKMKNRVLKLITFSVTITLGYNVDYTLDYEQLNR